MSDVVGDLIDRMDGALEVIDYARKEEPDNLDYIWIEIKVELWRKDLAELLKELYTEGI